MRDYFVQTSEAPLTRTHAFLMARVCNAPDIFSAHSNLLFFMQITVQA